MRICRFQREQESKLGFYFGDTVVPVRDALEAYGREVGLNLTLPEDDILALLPHSAHAEDAQTLATWLAASDGIKKDLAVETATLDLRNPLPDPGKILLLAGNYAKHIQEGGEIAEERQDTFPYIFTKPRTALNDPNAEIVIPGINPDFIDYECELTIVMGKKAKGVSEAEALDYVAGYTIVNDISDRKYKPNPGRKERPRDAFFDWMHGKWHDGFCPVGPAITSAAAIPDPQCLDLRLTVNGEQRQHTNTERMIFPVAAVVEFISRWITLEPGDIIATGTCEGIGLSDGRLLRAGDVVEATIEGIGTLKNTMVAESVDS